MLSASLAICSTWALAATMSSSTSIALDYDAPADCTDEAGFWTELETRSVRTLARGPGHWRLKVRITSEGDGFVGRAALSDEDTDYQEREIKAQRCEEVSAGLALIAAMALEELTLRKRPPADAAPSTPPSTPPDRSPTRGPARSPTPTAAIPGPAPTPLALPPHPWRLELGVGVGLIGGALPETAPQLPVYLGVFQRRDRSATSFRLSVVPAWSQTEVEGGEASFVSVTGQLDACPWAPVIGVVELAPCAALQLGVWIATGRGLENATTEVRPWVAPGGLGRVRLSSLEPYVLEAEVGFLVPIIRDRYYFGPDTLVHEAAPISGVAKIGASMTF